MANYSYQCPCGRVLDYEGKCPDCLKKEIEELQTKNKKQLVALVGLNETTSVLNEVNMELCAKLKDKSELIKALEAKVVLEKAKNEVFRELLIKTEALAIEILKTELLVTDNKPTIDLINRTLKELEKDNE